MTSLFCAHCGQLGGRRHVICVEAALAKAMADIKAAVAQLKQRAGRP